MGDIKTIRPKHHAAAGPGTSAGKIGIEIEIPSLPPEVQALNETLSSTPIDLSRVGDLAEVCPQLISRVLRLCHNSLFNLPEPVSRLEHAVILAGAGNIRTLLLASAVIDYAAARLPLPVVQAFWQHSLTVARLSERLAAWSGEPQVEQAYLAGLLHDVGALPMLAAIGRSDVPPPSLPEWIADAPGTQRRRFGTDHCEVGSRIGVEWDFPLPLLEVFTGHHEPIGAPTVFTVTRFVAVAESVCQSCDGGWDSPAASSAPIQDLIGQITANGFPGLSSDAASYLEQILQPVTAVPGPAWNAETSAGAAGQS